MRIFKAPNDINHNITNPSIFLAGSIEMGKADDWQVEVENSFKDYDVDLYNPRRDDWDSSWTQSKNNKQFNEQVSWELNALEDADYILMYFSPSTMSPISLLEFGLYANRRDSNMLVVCPEGFWRKGNVDIVCEYYGVRQFDTIYDAINEIKRIEFPDEN